MGAGHAHPIYVHEHSRVHRLAPQVKVAVTLGFVLAVALTSRYAWWAFLIDAAALAGVVRLARVPARFVLLRLLVITPFVLLALLIPVIGAGERVELWGLALSREGLWAGWNIIAKAGLGAGASILLAATTPVPQILAGLDRLRVPPTLTAIAGFMVRYLELIAGELSRTRTAMAARGYAPRWIWQARPAAAAAGTLFLRSYERGERVHAAMLARGYTGVMPRIDDERASPGQWLACAGLPLLAATAGAVGWVLTR